MNRKIISGLCLMGLLMSFAVVNTYAETKIGVKVNGFDINFHGSKVIIGDNNRALVPVREFCEAIGAKVKWDDNLNQVSIFKKDIQIQVGINQKNAIVNGEKKAFDSAVIMKNNKAYVPIRSITAALNEQIEWVEANQTVNVIVDPEYQYYRGQLHSHTSISDGKGTIEEAFAWARDQEAIDFLAVTDHPQMFDHEDTANLGQHESEEWQSIKTAVEKYTEEGKFIAIAGYEMSYYDKLSGHLNTFNTEGFLSGTQVNLEQYYQQLEKFPDSITQFNHPGPYWGYFNNFGYYSKDRDAVIHLIEVGNGPGTIQDKQYWRVDAYYSKALDKGWHVAPSNGQDNHEKNWGNSNPYRTVVLAKELSQEAIFDAIRAHRVFASEDNNVEVDYSINGYEMGSEIRDTVGAVDINLAIMDPDQNDSVHDISVISNGGKVVAYQAYERKDRKVFYQVSLKPSNGSAYYYVKIRQKDGNYIFTAPIWVEK